MAILKVCWYSYFRKPARSELANLLWKADTRRLEIKMNKNVDNKKPQRNHKIKTLETSDLMYFACVSHSQDVNFLLPPQSPFFQPFTESLAYQCKKKLCLATICVWPVPLFKCSMINITQDKELELRWLNPSAIAEGVGPRKNWKWSTLIGTESAWNSETEKLRRDRLKQCKFETTHTQLEPSYSWRW